jgi:hypothetical protein
MHQLFGHSSSKLYERHNDSLLATKNFEAKQPKHRPRGRIIVLGKAWYRNRKNILGAK